MHSVLICDASYDDNYGLVGYAGSVTVNGTKVSYSGGLAGAESSNESELYAVYAGLVHLVENDKNNAVSLVHIFSDSSNALDRLKNEKKGLKKTDLELHLLKKIRSISNEHGLEMVFNHVKAHQSAKTASTLERRHNEIDKIAYFEMKSRRKVLENLNRDGSRFYGVVVDSHPSARLAEQYEHLGYALAVSGMHARVHLQGAVQELSEHPFYRGVARYAKESMSSMDKLITEVLFSKQPVMGFTDRMLGCQGLDSCLLVKKMQVSEDSKIDMRSAKANAAGGASRLLLGYQSRTKGDEVAKSTFMEQPSLFAINLSLADSKEPKITDWLKDFSEQVGTPYFKSIKSLLAQFEFSGKIERAKETPFSEVSYGT